MEGSEVELTKNRLDFDHFHIKKLNYSAKLMADGRREDIRSLLILRIDVLEISRQPYIIYTMQKCYQHKLFNQSIRLSIKARV